jgi:hypothetical protein
MAVREDGEVFLSVGVRFPCRDLPAVVAALEACEKA